MLLGIRIKISLQLLRNEGNLLCEQAGMLGEVGLLSEEIGLLGVDGQKFIKSLLQYMVLCRLLTAHLPHFLETEVIHLLQQLHVLRWRCTLEV